MFQTLTIPSSSSSSQSLSFAAKSSRPSNFSFNTCEPRRPFSVSCRAAAPAGCLVASPASLYEVLRLNHTASPADIKTAYRRLAKKYHPDVGFANSPDGSDFIQIHKAYETLSDPDSRATYDRSMSFAGKRVVARSAASTTPFSSYSSSSSLGRRPGFHPTRRWESDQCW